MVEANKETVRRYFALSNEGRIDEYFALLTDDFRLIGMGMPAAGCDHDMSASDLAANARAYEGAFAKRITIDIDELAAEGDVVVVRAKSHARTSSGVEYANQYVFWLTFRDGKVASIREYCCTWTVVHVLREAGVGLTKAG